MLFFAITIGRLGYAAFFLNDVLEEMKEMDDLDEMEGIAGKIKTRAG